MFLAETQQLHFSAIWGEGLEANLTITRAETPSLPYGLVLVIFEPLVAVKGWKM